MGKAPLDQLRVERRTMGLEVRSLMLKFACERMADKGDSP